MVARRIRKGGKSIFINSQALAKPGDVFADRKYYIIAFDHLWSPNLSPISVRPLLYTPNYLIFMPIFSSVSHCARNLCAWVFIYFLHYCPFRERSQYVKEGEEGGVMQMEKYPMWVCAQNYSGARFIVPGQGPILGPSSALGSAGYWVEEQCRSYGSKTSRPLL